KADGRRNLLSLTARGRAAFAPLETRTRDETDALLKALPPVDQARLVAAMETIETLMCAGSAAKAPYLPRPPQPRHMGWVVHRHGAVYSEEYGWDERFEALVAGIVAKFAARHDPRRERCWMAEREGQVVGSVFLVAHRKTVAQLRLLLVEPSARGLGIGER